MKTLPGTRIIVVTAIGLLAGGAILVFAQTPTRTPNPQDLPFHLALVACTEHDRDNYNHALKYWKHRPNYRHDDYKMRYGTGRPDGDYPEPDASPCDGKAHSNVTQHLATNNADDLATFLTILDN